MKRTCTILSLRRARAAFTLVELLVVIAILIVLMAMLLPVLSKVRAMSRQTRCMGNARQTMVALNAYAIQYREYPPNMAPGVQMVPGNAGDNANKPYWMAPAWEGAEGVPS